MSIVLKDRGTILRRKVDGRWGSATRWRIGLDVFRVPFEPKILGTHGKSSNKILYSLFHLVDICRTHAILVRCKKIQK